MFVAFSLAHTCDAHADLESAARHVLLDNVEAGCHALRAMWLCTSYAFELHNVPANHHQQTRKLLTAWKTCKKPGVNTSSRRLIAKREVKSLSVFI